MARRHDTGWRDQGLAVRHESWSHPTPAAGTPFPMIEYDRGLAVALISYQARHLPLPNGENAVRTHAAFSRLHRRTSSQLPFFTAIYDVRNWAYSLFGHNDAARDMLDSRKWVRMTERQFQDHLYRLRGRIAPDLAPYGVVPSEARWWPEDPEPGVRVVEDWPHQLMSTRRRNFEPVGQTRMTWRNPCLDIDLAVVDRLDRVALVVDYKADGARINPDSTNARALATLRTNYGGSNGPLAAVPAMLVSYRRDNVSWTFRVKCLNDAASRLLSYTLGAAGQDTALASVVGDPKGWHDLSESQWRTVLDVAREL